MDGVPISDQIALGILRTRDLVELYYQGRMVCTVIENVTSQIEPAAQLLGPHPSRIKYEITLANNDPGNLQQVFLGSQQSFTSGGRQQINIPIGSTVFISRNFLTDLDGVTAAVFCFSHAAAVVISTRETILTPLPVDEEP